MTVADDPPLAKAKNPLADKDCRAADRERLPGGTSLYHPVTARSEMRVVMAVAQVLLSCLPVDFLVIAVTRRAWIIVRLYPVAMCCDLWR
jgi:hypothetical protein